MMPKSIQIKTDHPLLLPERKTAGAAGFDLFYRGQSPYHLYPGDRAAFPTGINLAIPDNMVGIIKDRSGLAVIGGITTLAGVIDSDFRGEVQVALYNTSITKFTITPGQRIAQIVFLELPYVYLQLVDTLPETLRGGNGFGSTGI